MFDELFPSTSRKFRIDPPSGSVYVDGRWSEEKHRVWNMWLLADELLKLAASYRAETGDLFSRRRFWSKLEEYRTEMAKRNSTTKRDMVRQDERPEWKGFIDYRLSDEELAELDEWQPSSDDIWVMVDKMINDRRRLTLSYNSRQHLASCTIIDDDSERKTGGYALSSADTDGALALKMACFKHLKLGEDWTDMLTDDKPHGRRG